MKTNITTTVAAAATGIDKQHSDRMAALAALAASAGGSRGGTGRERSTAIVSFVVKTNDAGEWGALLASPAVRGARRDAVAALMRLATNAKVGDTIDARLLDAACNVGASYGSASGCLYYYMFENNKRNSDNARYASTVSKSNALRDALTTFVDIKL